MRSEQPYCGNCITTIPAGIQIDINYFILKANIRMCGIFYFELKVMKIKKRISG